MTKDGTEDIVQDTFTNIWLGRKFIQVDVPFSTYLYTIVKNRVLNQLRSLERQHILEDHVRTHAIDYAEDAQNELLSQDLKGVVQKAFETLSPRQQKVFRLSREGHMSYKEIADNLGISVNTVHEHITSCLHIIRQYLIKYCEMKSDVLSFLLLFILSP